MSSLLGGREVLVRHWPSSLQTEVGQYRVDVVGLMANVKMVTGANVIVPGRDQDALDATKRSMQKRFIKDGQVCQAEGLDLTNPLKVSTTTYRQSRTIY